MNELFRAIEANDPSIAQSNIIDRSGTLTETILPGNLAVWSAPKALLTERSSANVGG